MFLGMTSHLSRLLEYYDGPRLILQRSRAGQLYLAWWNDADESIDRWIYLPVSEWRLRAILSGHMPVLDALKDPEDGNLLVVDIDVATDSVVQTVVTTAASLPEDSLPLEWSRLNIPMPEGISGLPLRERAHLLNVKMESKLSDPTGRVNAKIVGQFIGNLQRLFDAIGQAKSGQPTSRGVIPDSVLNDTRLDPIGTYTGSFGILLETNKQDDLIGDSLAKTSLQGLFDLFEVGHHASGLTLQLTELKARVAKNYKDFLSTIETSLSTASLVWSQPGKMAPRQVHFNQESARNTIAQIDSVADLTQNNLTLEATLIGGNVRTLRFEIATSETGERFDGLIHEDAHFGSGANYIEFGMPSYFAAQLACQ